MEINPITLAMMAIVFTASALAGIALIRRALAERTTSQRSMLHRAANEARFRLRLAAGVGLILWVLSGVLWIVSRLR